MRERSIVVPDQNFNLLYDWAYEATGQDEPAAKLINEFLYHYDNRFANRILVELIERAMHKHRRGLRELGDWMPYSIAYMEELLLFAHGKTQVIQSRIKLIELGFISDKVPDAIPEFYSRSHSWYRFEIDNVKDWINQNWLPHLTRPIHSVPSSVKEAISAVSGRPMNGMPDVRETPTVETTPKVATVDAPDTLHKQISALGKFYIHVHGKNSAFILDSERKNRIRAILKTLLAQVGETKALAMCAQAIIGNLLSDFHQGRHPDNTLGVVSESTGNTGKIFDDIGEYIFKNAKRFDAMLGHAENSPVLANLKLPPVTEEVALTEFKKVLAGQPSRYTKQVVRGVVSPQTVKGTQLQAPQPYKDFARDVATFFFTKVPTKQILEMCQQNTGLSNLGKGLRDTTSLFNALMIVGKNYGANGVPEGVQMQMKEFAEKFSEIQEYN